LQDIVVLFFVRHIYPSISFVSFSRNLRIHKDQPHLIDFRIQCLDAAKRRFYVDTTWFIDIVSCTKNKLITKHKDFIKQIAAIKTKEKKARYRKGFKFYIAFHDAGECRYLPITDRNVDDLSLGVITVTDAVLNACVTLMQHFQRTIIL
jgi:hypothetical protein